MAGPITAGVLAVTSGFLVGQSPASGQPPAASTLVCQGCMSIYDAEGRPRACDPAHPAVLTLTVDARANRLQAAVAHSGPVTALLRTEAQRYSATVSLPGLVIGEHHVHALEMRISRHTGLADFIYRRSDDGTLPAFVGQCLPAAGRLL